MGCDCCLADCLNQDLQDFGIFGMAGTPLALERSYGCLNCDYWIMDGQDYCAFAIWGCRSAVGTGLEDGRFVCCWVFQKLGGGARTGAGRGSAGQEGGRVVRGDGLGAEGDEVGVVGGGEGVDGFGGGEGLLAECFGFAALCGVEDEDAVGEGGNAGVVPERTSRSVQRLAFRGRCPARVLRYSQGHAASRGRSARIQLR